MLTAHEIRTMRMSSQVQRILIQPWNPKHINPNSYDLTLAEDLLVYEPGELDVRKENPTRIIKIPDEGYVLTPGELYLGCSLEYTESHGLVPMINGRSSLARLGVSVHQTGGFGDIGFCGNWTLEITCVRPVRIYAGMRFAQLCWFFPDGNIDQSYEGKYQNSRGPSPVASRLHTE